jgi:hypothetical protein
MRPNASDSALSTQVERLIGTQMTRRVWEALSMPNTASAGASQRRVLTVPRRRNALVRDDCPQELSSAHTRRNEHQKPGTTWVCTKSVSTKGVHAIDASTPAFAVRSHDSKPARRSTPRQESFSSGWNLVPVRGYAKGGNGENVEFVGIAA